MNNNNPKLTPFAQRLRKEMTKEESRLWYGWLRKLPVGFKRQKVIGDYIADFYCPSKKIAIEIDGSQHFSEQGVKKDQERDAFLKSRRITVLRYSNAELNENFDGVCMDIYYRITGVITEPQHTWLRDLNYHDPDSEQ